MPKVDFRSGAINALLNKGLTSADAERVGNYITAQAQHESANFSSNIYMKDNNCIGMKFPSVRKAPNVVGKDANGYATYPNDAACAADMVDWLATNNAPVSSFKTLRAYTDWLGLHHYYEDSRDNYYKGANRFYNEIGPPAETIAGEIPQGLKMAIVVGVCLVTAFAFLFRR